MPPQNFRHLTRRSLLSNLLIHSRCPHRLPPAARVPAPPLPVRQQCRAISLSSLLPRGKKPPRPTTPPGMDTLIALMKYLDQKIGPAPPPEAVVQAFAAMIQYCKGAAMREDHAALMLRGYEYLCAAGEVGQLPDSIVVEALQVLRGGAGAQMVLARMLWEDLKATGKEIPEDATFFFIIALCQSGGLSEATEICRGLSTKSMKTWRCWDTILEGFTKRGDETELLETMEYIRKTKRAPDKLYYHPVAFYCARDDLGSAEVWFKRAVEDRRKNVLPVYVAILNACARTGRLEWGDKILEKMLRGIVENQQNKLGQEEWDTVMQFSMAKGIDAGKRVLETMAARGFDLNVDTLNNLIAGAVSQNHWGYIDDLIEIMGEKGIEPNYRTYELQIQQQRKLGNFHTALEVFNNMRYTQGFPDNYTGEIPQKLLSCIADAQRTNPNVTQDMAITMYNELLDMKIFLEHDACHSVFALLLRQSDFKNAHVLLNRHVGHYSAGQRLAYMKALLRHAQSRDVSNENAWEAYLLLVRTLPETGLQHRQRMMETFFARGLPRAATRVLEHMVQSDDRRPNKFQYTAAFVGIAQSADIECLLTAQKLLNMDPYVDVDTPLLNAMMNAYARCGAFDRAFDIYDQIAHSHEGPDHATLSQVFDMCGRVREPRELARAKRLWALYTRKFKISLTDNNVASYVEALARHGEWDHAWSVVRDLPYKLGMQPGHRTLSTLHSTFKRNRLLELEAWLESEYPETWAAVVEELNATANKKEEIPDKVVIDGQEFTVVDAETGKPVNEPEETFRTSLNLRGSEGFDEDKARRDRTQWESRKREKGEQAVGENGEGEDGDGVCVVPKKNGEKMV